MSSERGTGSGAVRRWAPWVLYGVAAVAAIPLYRATAGSGACPAEVEVRRVSLSGPRTAHRLRVEEVRVAPGDAVSAGQVLARMESSELDAELAAGRRRLDELELTVDSLQARRGEDRTRAANQLAHQAERARVEQARLAAEEQQDRSELAQLEVAAARERALVADRVADGARLQQLELRRAGLTARLAQLRGAVEQAEQGATSAGQRLAVWRGAVGVAGAPAPLAGELAPARAAAEAQRERVRELAATVARLELRAPFDGRVEAVLLQPGETTGADGTVLTVVDEHPHRAVAWVEPRWATRVRVGDRARLVPQDASGPPLQGRVAALAPAITELPARFAPVLRRWGRAVYVELDGREALPGQAFDATFRPGEER